MNLTGSILQAYHMCPRQAWLMAHQISGDQQDDSLSIGRLISEDSFKRDKKEIIIGNSKIDIVRKKKGEVILIETKKSSRALESAILQLLYYMYNLKDKTENVRGEIHIPKEKKVELVVLSPENIKKIETNMLQAEKVINSIKPEKAIKKKYCRTCSYNEFCWA